MPHEDMEVTIVGFDEVPVVENNRVRQYMRIYFTVNDGNQQSVDVLKAGYTAQKGKAAVMQLAREIYETLK